MSTADSTTGLPRTIDGVRATAIHRLEASGLADLARSVAETGCRVRATVTPRDRRVMNRYLASASEPKLHIGSSAHLLAGWLNTDAIPLLSEVAHLDATRRFPLPGNRFTRAYSEHVIEHIRVPGAQTMLAECFRVLAPGGVLRISTPDLAFLYHLQSPDRSATEDAYLEWMERTWLGNPLRGLTDPTAAVVNHFMRAWGHRFIYDEATLRAFFANAGFVNVERRAICESPHADLRDLENVDRLPESFIPLETLTLEGTKPAGSG